VVVVVPSFAVRENGHDEIVSAGFVGCVISVAPTMRNRVDCPGLVPDDDGAHEDAPNEQAQPELNGLRQCGTRVQRGNNAALEEHRPRDQNDRYLPDRALKALVESFTEQIAGIAFVDSEPVEFLVAEKEPAHMAPE